MKSHAGLILLLALVASCTPASSGPEGDWVREETVEGEVTTVHTLSGSVWGAPARLIQEASIGEAEGEEHYLLGDVSSLCADDERIFVLDMQVPTLRVYDRAGRWLQDIGRSGGGPGELSRPTSVRVSPVDGRIFIRDGSQGRLNVYTGAGDPLETWPLRSGFMTSRQLVMAPDGALYTYIPGMFDPQTQGFRYAYARLGPEGTTSDTLRSPYYGFEEATIEARGENMFISNPVPFSPRERWELSPLRTWVGGISTDYRFDVHFPDGRITRIEKTWERIPVDPDERSWHRSRAVANMRGMVPGWAWNGPEPGQVKPPFDGFLTDGEGRIWVLRQGAGVMDPEAPPAPDNLADFYARPRWKEAWFVDVFDHRGRFMGSLDIPPGFETYPQPWIEGEDVIALVTGEDDVPRVKRFRLLIPESGSR
jgi:hypothetical protein